MKYSFDFTTFYQQSFQLWCKNYLAKCFKILPSIIRATQVPIETCRLWTKETSLPPAKQAVLNSRILRSYFHIKDLTRNVCSLTWSTPKPLQASTKQQLIWLSSLYIQQETEAYSWVITEFLWNLTYLSLYWRLLLRLPLTISPKSVSPVTHSRLVKTKWNFQYHDVLSHHCCAFELTKVDSYITEHSSSRSHTQEHYINRLLNYSSF